MIWHICPECKEILSGDELRGSNSACKACSMRKDRSDLIEIDSEHPEESQEELDAKAQEEQKSYVPALPIDNIALVPGTYWEKNSLQDGNNTRTLVIKLRSKGKFALWSLMFVNVGMVTGLELYEVSSIAFWGGMFIMLILFICIGLWLFCEALRINLSQNSISFRRGLFRKGKFTVFDRTSKDIKVKVFGAVNFKYGEIVISDGKKSKTIIHEVDEKSLGRAEEIASVIRMLINAKI